MRLSDLLDQYAIDRAVKPSTLDQLRYAVVGFEHWLGRPGTLDDLDREPLNKYLAAIADRYSVYTVKSKRNQLAQLWKYCFDYDLVDRMPRRVRVVKTPIRIIRAWTPDDMRRLVAVAETLTGRFRMTRIPKSLWWSCWLRVAWDSGLRPSDQTLLRRQDCIDGQGNWPILQAKTGRPVRVVLNPGTLERLHQLWHFDDGPLVLPRVYSRGQANKALRYFAEPAGFTGVQLTRIRKSVATAAERLQPGTGWRTLGHTSPETTRRWYIDTRAYDGLQRHEEL